MGYEKIELQPKDRLPASVVNAMQDAIIKNEKEIAEREPQLLWENASPTSKFSPQTITLDLSEYSSILMNYRVSVNLDSGVNVRTSSILLVGEKSFVSETWCRGEYNRHFDVYEDRIVANAGLVFPNKGANNNSTWSDDGTRDTCIIPLKIWGIK